MLIGYLAMQYVLGTDQLVKAGKLLRDDLKTNKQDLGMLLERLTSVNCITGKLRQVFVFYVLNFGWNFH